MSPAAPSKRWALRRMGRMLAGELRDGLSPHRAGGPREVPHSPEEIGPEWLSTALCPPGSGARVVSVRRVGGSRGTTSRVRLQAVYNDAGMAAGLPTGLFVKCTSTFAQRVMLGLGGFIASEPGFYENVRPGLDIEAPQGYFQAADVRSWRSIVVMEDVASTRQATFWQPASTVARQHITSLLTAAATWHGALWEDPRLARWTWLKTPAEHMALIDALIRLADRTKAGMARAAHVIPAALSARQADLFPALRRSMALASSGPSTFLHGDLHVANTYLTGQGRPGVCDWQTPLRGSWAFDYANLVITALAIEDRRAWEHELLDLYLERLSAAGGPRVTRAEAWEAYRRLTLYPYFAWLYTVGRSRLQPDFQPRQTGLLMVQRIATAIDDLGTLAALGS